MEMKPSWEFLKAPNLAIKITAFSLLLSLSVFFFLFSSISFPFSPTLFTYPSFHHHSNDVVTRSPNAFKPPSPLPPPSPSPTPSREKLLPVLETMGIVDEHGAMADDFKVGDLDPKLADEVVASVSSREKETEKDKEKIRIRVKKYEFCDQKMREFIPCLDNVDAIRGLNSTGKGENFERHCPGREKGLNCLIPAPKDYRSPIPWPQSRNEVWFSNIPHTHLVEDKGGQNWISTKGDKFVFPGGGTQFIHGADQYLDQISQMVLDIKFGQNIRVALDIGCGVASFGAFLLQRNVTTLSIAPKDVHENQIQFVLERGVPAMISVFATRRLLYPSQGFDFIHCSRCRVNWTRDDGILLLEVNRLLRAGGYFAWAAQPVYKHEDNLREQWKEMENLTSRICWELVKKEGYIAIWRKPLNNSCYLSRGGAEVQPPLCDASDDPDHVWYVNLKPCITRLPNSGYGANVSTWPKRLHNPPERLQSIQMDAYISRKEIFKAESKYWREILQSYINAFHWKKLKMRNVMDMRAGYGGFAAALHDLGFNSWVMNVVPVSGYNTLPVIYDRGLIGVMHDWCEAFDTYPRTYDLLHASGLFSVERKRCDISTILVEMDRMLRPDGIVYVRDSIPVLEELRQIAAAMRWVCTVYNTGEGPHASWKILKCDKHR